MAINGFYGHTVEHFCDSSWNLLRRLGQNQYLPWLTVGDFNEIVFSFEKQGGHERPNRQMEYFHSALLDCDLHDLGFKSR